MIASLEQAKAWMRLEPFYTDEDALIQGLLAATEQYIYNATGIHFTGDNALAVLLQQVLVSEMRENREVTVTEQIKTRPIVQSIMVQLQYAESGEAE